MGCRVYWSTNKEYVIIVSNECSQKLLQDYAWGNRNFVQLFENMWF